MAQAFDEAPLALMKERDRAVVERAIACVHFSGEVAGRGDERDQWLAQKMKELRCERIASELRGLVPLYSAPAVQSLLQELADIFAD